MSVEKKILYLYEGSFVFVNLNTRVNPPFMEEKKTAKVSATTTESLIQDLRQIIEHARSHVASTVNYALSIMYWKIGERINNEILDNRRAEYGKQIVASVARQLREEYGAKGFDEKIGVELWHYSQATSMGTAMPSTTVEIMMAL